MAFGGLLNSFFKNKKPEDWAGLLNQPEGPNPYIPTGPGSTGFHQQYMPQPGQQSILMRNAPGRQPQGPPPATHIPFMPIDALRRGTPNPFAQTAGYGMGPLQNMMNGQQQSPPPSHIPFAPTEGLEDPDYLFRQQLGQF